MQIVESLRFTKDINIIADFIAKDSKARAREFQKDLKSKLQILKTEPKAFRKSTKFNNINIRDFIYKGYVVPYLIDKDKILILGIYKANEWNE